MTDNAITKPGAPSDALVGQHVAGLFVIESLLGQGTSSRVYRASHLTFRHTVAIKVLNREYLDADNVRARFHREARIASRIAHPAVVKVLMTGELPNDDTSQGEAFIVYEHVAGLTLRKFLDERGPLSIEAILGLVVATGNAVAAAHDLNIVHRDLKPENLMIVAKPDGKMQLRVLDFGLAKVHESSDSYLTHTGAILGTPSYLSPEGARGQPATPRSDVYSLATIAYECLAGYPPFRDASPIRVLMQQVDNEPPPLRRPPGAGDIPASVAQVIMANLCKSPRDRADNARSFARAIAAAAGSSHLTIDNYGPDSALWDDFDDQEPATKGDESQSPVPKRNQGTL